MKLQALFAPFACFALAACATTSAQLPAPPSAPNAASARPEAQSTVDIHLVNESDAHIAFGVEYSYPASPFWIDAHVKCLNPSANWNTYIDYKHASPETAIRAIELTTDCSSRGLSVARFEFKGMHFKNGRALLQAKLTGSIHTELQLCAKQSGDKEYKCKDMRG